MPEGVGEMLRFAVVPLVVGGMRIVVPVDRLRVVHPPLSVAEDDTPESFAWADSGIGIWAMTDLFTADAILLVIELEGGNGDLVDAVWFIQSSVRGAVNAAVNGC